MSDTDTDTEEAELIASEVDELTHAELLCLYRDAEENIRFSKLLQWRITGGTLAIYLLFTLMASSYAAAGGMTKILIILSFLVGSISMSILAIFQSWQGTEREKVRLIIGKLSSLARRVHNTKPKRMANIERYSLYGFMCCAILTGGFFALSRLMRWFPT
ncbi:MAG: hypothetical protein O3C34_20415 [Proteobacteria bacterium]|nr:hypothetical protein [Pseudomonadota bacterium]